MSTKGHVAVIAILVAAFLAIGTLYAVKTPDWQAPDEPAHFNYVEQVVQGGCCPVIAPGDWDSAALEKLKAEGFPDGADLSRIQYEDHQPPAYYLIGSLLFRLTGAHLLGLRLLSLVFGAGVVLATYIGLLRLFPGRPGIAAGGSAFVAFLPQHLAIAASANNDSLAVLIVSMLAVAALTYLGNPVEADGDGALQPLDAARRPHAAALGGLLGAAFVTKLTIYAPAALVAGLAIAFRWRIERRAARWLVEQTAWVGGMSLAFALPWWVRDVTVYGWPDVAGLDRHNAVVAGQPLTADLIQRVGAGEYVRAYATTVYHSFFGQFGWMGVPMPPAFYLGIGVFLMFALGGLMAAMAMCRDRAPFEPVQRAGMWALAGLAAATMAGLVDYNLRFVQFQGRYLFPMLMAVGGLVAFGLWGWAQAARKWLRGEAWAARLEVLPVLLLVWMPALALWALYRFVVPNLK